MEDFACVWLILITVPVVPLFTLSALFAEPRVGKERVKGLEENARSSICSLLAGTAALAADSLYPLPNRHSPEAQSRGPFLGGAHICLQPAVARDQAHVQCYK